MNVLITGAGGFIGSHLTEKCVEDGHQVTAFVRYNSMNHWGFLENSPYLKDIEVIAGDIRDFDSVSKAVRGRNAVFHLAALIGIPYSYESPLAYIKTNINGTYNVLQAARECETAQVLITSTSETYGTAKYVPIDEKHPPVGQSPYAATKIAADQIALSYYRSFGLPVKVVRPFNTFGPRQSTRAVIPTIITQLLKGQQPIRLGDCRPTRDFTYVKDTASAFLEIMNAPALEGQAANIGNGREISVGDLATVIADIMGKGVQIEEDADRIRPADSEVERLLCDNAKLIQATSWRPRYTLVQGIQETIQWVSEYEALFKTGRYTV